ncbi:MAG: hypothetical protein RLZZ502_891 [Pseudomonadota bacterium]|jgi:predicted nucleic acid-binding protein
MALLVLDASVFLKAIKGNEEDSDLAKNLLLHIMDEDITVLVPRLFYYEVYGVATREGMKCSLIDTMLKDFENTCLRYVTEDHLQVIALTKLGNSKSGYPSFYDSCYHAIAIAHQCDLVTANKRHYDKAKKLGHIKLLA